MKATKLLNKEPITVLLVFTSIYSAHSQGYFHLTLLATSFSTFKSDTMSGLGRKRKWLNYNTSHTLQKSVHCPGGFFSLVRVGQRLSHIIMRIIERCSGEWGGRAYELKRRALSSRLMCLWYDTRVWDKPGQLADKQQWERRNYSHFNDHIFSQCLENVVVVKTTDVKNR